MLLDYLIVGAGLSGAVCSRILTEKGYVCKIIEKSNQVGGNCYDEECDGIMVHKFGPHIFHTNNDEVWSFVNRFASFNSFRYKPIVSYNKKFYSFPVNLFTLYQMWGVKTPAEAEKIISKKRIKIKKQESAEEWLLSRYGQEIYDTFFYGYTKKQWGIDPSQLPASIVKRVPVRFVFNDNYYFDRYQGIPRNGYTALIKNVINAEVALNTDYFSNRKHWNSVAKNVIFTGRIDEYYGYRFGRLPYRSLVFEDIIFNEKSHQGGVAINYTNEHNPMTRSIEHKHFYDTYINMTIVTHEYPKIGRAHV